MAPVASAPPARTVIVSLESPQQLVQRITTAAGWHARTRHAGKNQAPPVCAECGFPWPCRTWRLLTGGSGD